MNRSNPPCNACKHIDCRNCSWLSPLHASYRTILLHHSLLALFAVSTREVVQTPPQPSLFRKASSSIARFFAEFLPRSR
jgi:hypothetical protein